MKLKQKVAIITGGGSGMGRAVAEQFACNGAGVVIAEINAGSGEEVVATIRKNGGEAIFVHSDVSKTADVRAMIATTVNATGAWTYFITTRLSN